jgi:DnaJ-class molecular chaperone
MKESYICPVCNGSGEGRADGTSCHYCGGEGEVHHLNESKKESFKRKQQMGKRHEKEFY